MEYALRDYVSKEIINHSGVLILVLMEYALRGQNLKRPVYQYFKTINFSFYYKQHKKHASFLRLQNYKIKTICQRAILLELTNSISIDLRTLILPELYEREF